MTDTICRLLNVSFIRLDLSTFTLDRFISNAWTAMAEVSKAAR